MNAKGVLTHSLLLFLAGSEAFQPNVVRLPKNSILLPPPVGRPALTHCTSKAAHILPLREANGHLFAADASSEASEEPMGEGGGGGTGTIPALTANLVKGIVGAGTLTLPAGIAAFANAPSAIYPAIFLITIIGALSGYGFGLIGRVCALTGTSSFRDAWNESVSEKTGWVAAWSVTLMTLFAVLAYSMILGDTFQVLALTAGFNIGKTSMLLAMTSLVLLPLCLLKDLSSLAPFSLLGSLGMIYTVVVMGIRYFGRAYVPGIGRFAKDVVPKFQPSFGDVGAAGALTPAATILLGMLSTAYMAHFNAPKFYTELKDNTIPRYCKMVGTSFAISIGIFAAMAGLGFLTFGENSSGLILNNYSPKDALMGVSRIAVALSLVFSYPLAFTGMRDGVLDILQVKDKTNRFLNGLTVGMLSGITFLATIIPDVSFVMAFAGATIGNALIYIFPALMFRGAVRKIPNPTKGQKTEVKIALGSAVVGLAMGIMGATKAVQSIL